MIPVEADTGTEIPMSWGGKREAGGRAPRMTQIIPPPMLRVWSLLLIFYRVSPKCAPRMNVSRFDHNCSDRETLENIALHHKCTSKRRASMFSVLQVTGVLLCGALLWSGYPKRPTPMKRKERIGSRKMMAMSRTTRQQPDSVGPS
jgi:hypothetical protein